MRFLRVSHENGLWQKLLNAWETEASAFGENIEDYAPATLDVLSPLAEESQRKNSGVFAVESDSGDYIGMCQLNAAFLPGYQGKVLRVRHIIHSPRFDYDPDLTIDDYQNFLAEVFLGVFDVSNDQMLVPHIKFHFRSPAERAFFGHIKDILKDHDAFATVEMRGAWLYVSKQAQSA